MQQPTGSVAAGAPQASEAQFMSQLILFLGKFPNGTCSIAQVEATVPEAVRQHLQAVGGLTGWIKNYPSLFAIAGENVMLTLHMPPTPPITHNPPPVAQEIHNTNVGLPAPWAAMASFGMPSMPPMFMAPPFPMPSIDAVSFQNSLAYGSAPTYYAMEPQVQEARNDIECIAPDNMDPTVANCAPSQDRQQPAILLRGLPFSATINDIRDFIGPFQEHLEGDDPIQIILNKGKRASGLCQISFHSADVVEEAISALQNKIMRITGDVGSGKRERYIEVFSAAEWPIKRKKMIAGLSAGEKADASEAKVNVTRFAPASDAYVEESPKKGACIVKPVHVEPEPARVLPSGTSPDRQTQRSGPTLWLHGLPLNTSEQDVFTFLSLHEVVHCVAESSGAVHLLTEGGDKLTALAVIETRSPEDAKLAQRAVHGQRMHMKEIYAELRNELTYKDENVNATTAGDAYTSPRPCVDTSRNLMALVSPLKPQNKAPVKVKEFTLEEDKANGELNTVVDASCFGTPRQIEKAKPPATPPQSAAKPWAALGTVTPTRTTAKWPSFGNGELIRTPESSNVRPAFAQTPSDWGTPFPQTPPRPVFNNFPAQMDFHQQAAKNWVQPDFMQLAARAAAFQGAQQQAMIDFSQLTCPFSSTEMARDMYSSSQERMRSNV